MIIDLCDLQWLNGCYLFVGSTVSVGNNDDLI